MRPVVFHALRSASLALDVFGALSLLALFTAPFVGAWAWPLGFPLHFAEIGWFGATLGLVVACVRRSRARAALHAVWACAWLVDMKPPPWISWSCGVAVSILAFTVVARCR